MEIEERREGGVLIIKPIGRIDTNTAGHFEEKIVEELDAGETRFVIDLAQTDYISSAGLRVFLMAAKKLRGMGGRFVLCAMSDHIKEVFDISGFTPIFTITPDPASALQNIR